MESVIFWTGACDLFQEYFGYYSHSVNHWYRQHTQNGDDRIIIVARRKRWYSLLFHLSNRTWCHVALDLSTFNHHKIVPNQAATPSKPARAP